MAPATIPTSEPKSAISGDTWRWDHVDGEYSPADGWALKYAIRGPRALNITAVANSSNTGWEIAVSAADSAELTADDYVWDRWVEKAGERYTRGSGVLVVRPNLATANAGDQVSWARKTLTVLEKFFQGSIEDGILEHQIQGRAVKFHDPAYLMELRRELKRELSRARTGGRLISLQATMRSS